MKLLISFLALLGTGNVVAQENEHKWMIGIRNGLYTEIARSEYYGSAHDLSTLSWSQQGFFQKKIREHLLLEMTVTHFNIAHDLTGEKKNAQEQPYLSYKLNHQKFSHTFSLLYKLINSKKLEIYGGIGAGVISNFERYNYSYIDTLGHYKAEKNNIINIEAINFSGSIIANYSIADRWILTGNTGFSILSSVKSLSAYSLNIGLGYRL